MSKNKMNKALAANRVVALFSHKDKNGTPRYDIYKMKQESNPPTTTPQCTHLSMYFEGVQKQSSEPATKQMMQVVVVGSSPTPNTMTFKRESFILVTFY